MIPVLGFLTVSRHDLAERLLASIDYPVEHLVIVNNSGSKQWKPPAVEWAENVWHLEIPFGLGYGGGLNLIVKSTPFAPWWLLTNDDTWFERGQLEEIAMTADPTAMNFTLCEPKWSSFVLGETVVEQVGLFDERYYPIYFEDNDYERRMVEAGVKFKTLPVRVGHNNSSSLDRVKNIPTFESNHQLFMQKIAADDYSQGNWSLQRRRANAWE